MKEPTRVLVRFSRQINLFVGTPGHKSSLRFVMIEQDGMCYYQGGETYIPANELNPESVKAYLETIFYIKKLQDYTVVYKKETNETTN